MPIRDLVIIGGGGHASDVLSVVEAMNQAQETWRCIGYLSDDELPDRRLERRGLERLGDPSKLGAFDAHYALAIGYPQVRQSVAGRMDLSSHAAATLVHPDAVLNTNVHLEPGAVVLAGAVCSPDVQVQTHAYVSQLCSIGHDTVVGPFSSVMPGAMISGDVVMGRSVLAGTSSTVLQGLELGDNSVLGGGSLLTKDLPPGATGVGIPARWGSS